MANLDKKNEKRDNKTTNTLDLETTTRRLKNIPPTLSWISSIDGSIDFSQKLWVQLHPR